MTDASGTACPYISIDEVSSDIGFRLERITVLRQAGRVVGCRFYALQHPTAQCDQYCLDHEHLPPGDVPSIEIRATRYRSAVDAQNSVVRAAEQGRDAQSVTIEPRGLGACYRTAVWSHDKGTDWACAFAKGTTAVVVRTVVTDPAFNVAEIARAVATRV